MIRYLLLIGSTFLLANMALAQTCLGGKVTEEDTGDPVIFGSVAIYKNGVLITGAETDFDGVYSFCPIDPGTYDIEVSYVGFPTKRITGVVVYAEKSNALNVKMTRGIDLQEVVVIGYTVPLVEQDHTTQGKTLTSEEIKRRPKRGVNALASSSAGVTGTVKGSGLSIRGSRSDATNYYIDGTRISGRPINGENPDNANTEDYNPIQENAFLEATNNPLSTFSIDVDAASYSNLRRFIQSGQAPPRDAVRIEEMINYFNYDYPQPKGKTPFTVITEVGKSPWNEQHQLLHIGLQGQKIDKTNLPPSNLVFLIDVSGSMRAQNKLPLLKSSFKMLVDELRPQDRVAIVVYAGAAGQVLASTAGNQKKVIKDAFDKLSAGGSTAGGAGIQLAYKTAKEHFLKEGNNRVILATDGDFNVGQSSDAALVEMIEKERESGVFLTVLGFGTGNYKDNKMQQLADKGNGNHAYIDNLKEAKKVLINEFGGTLFTIAKDVKLQIEFNPAEVQAYRLIGYENRLLNKEDFNDDTKDAGELGSGHTVTALYEIIPTDVSNTFVADVDPLKYQKTGGTTRLARTKNELCTVKLRYKQPDGAKSQKIEEVVLAADDNTVENSSANFLWSAAVAEFGMLLRDSEYKANTTYDDCLTLAKSAVGKDENGYRAEMIGMIETMKGRK